MRQNPFQKCSVFLVLVMLFSGLVVDRVSAQIKINEILADNQTVLADPDKGNFGDWIELYNAGSQTVNLSGYGLSDDSENLHRWVFPDGTQISANSFLLVWADNDNIGLHTNYRLSKSGEKIILSDVGMAILDSISFIEQIEDVSFGRIADGGSEWAFFSNPSPGSSNASGSADFVAAPPVFSLNSGFYDGQQALSLITQSADAIIYYTLDGSIPTENSTRFEQTIILDTTSVVRAIQLENGYISSPVVSKSFLINEPTTLPVFSIITDPYNLWDLDSGIYVEGRNYVWDWFAGNFWQNWEKPCYVEFWESNRKQKIAQGAGLKINGALTRTASQKSMRIIARSEYGKTRFSYNFFKEKKINSYNQLVLRSSGNDWAGTMMSGGMMSTIVSGQMDIDYDAYRPAILFLNGVYWGIHNMREKVTDDWIEENHGFDKDNIDLLSQIEDIREGDRVAYDEVLNFAKSNSLADESNYSFMKAKMDMTEYINYYVAQIFYANIDWPAGNIKYWRPRTDTGIWRWIIFDTDLAYQDAAHNTLAWAASPEPPYEGATDLFINLLESEEFRQQFINTFQYHMATTFSADRIINIIDSLSTTIEPEMQRHISRWRGYHGWTFTTASGIYIETPWLDSYEDWQTNVEGFRHFSEVRADFLNAYVSAFFEYGTPMELSLHVDPPGSGKIWINEDRSTANSMNMVVFKDQELSIQPVDNLDTEFQQWNMVSGFHEIGAEVDLVPRNSTWKYLDNGQYPDNSWLSKDYNDSNWGSGPGALGYNYNEVQTLIAYGDDAGNKHVSYLFRHSFEVSSASDWSGLIVKVLRDDGAIVYLNGQEIVRSNMPETSDFSTLALAGVVAEDESTYFEFDILADYLVSGLNTLAVEVHQYTVSSSDLSFDLSLTGIVGSSFGESTIVQDAILANNFSTKTSLTAVFDPLAEVLPISINEVMPANKGAYLNHLGKTPDWVELYNPNDKIVDVGGLYITDDLLVPDKWQIPNNDTKRTSIPPKGFLVLLADEQVTLGAEHINIQFSGAGEEIALYQRKDDGFVLIDSLFYPALPADASFGRYPDGQDFWEPFLLLYTPGSENRGTTDSIPDAPLFLFPNYPNPFSSSTKIRFSLSAPAPVQLIVRDVRGNTIKTLTDREYDEGVQSIDWDGKDEQNNISPPGLYFCTVYSNFYSATIKMVKLR